jgi:hypothetical protein
MSVGTAFAWSDVSGTIDSIKGTQVVLDNGQTYSIQKGVSLSGLKKGDKVTLSVEAENGKNMVNKVTKS